MTMDKKEAVLLRGADLRHMILEACNYFELHKESINDLNVFPVPDGDTGTNMSLTMNAAAKKLQENKSDSIGEVAKIMAQSALMGARGNSGVILSQLFRGVARGLSGKNEARLTEVGKAFQYGIVYAYNAVSKPVEGTILTVAREIAKGSRQAVQTSLTFIDLLRIAVDSGRKALEQTPELLPVLKEAGVVDAGGLGLVVFLEGCLHSLLKSTIGEREEQAVVYKDLNETLVHPASLDPADKTDIGITAVEEFSSEYPYCTELLLKGKDLSVQKMREDLEVWGDSLLVAGEKEFIKVHIHTDHPGNVLEICLLHGSIHDIKIDNMFDQYQETQWGYHFLEDEKPEMPEDKSHPDKVLHKTISLPGSIGIVTVLTGDGLVSIFTGLGADKIVSGGQSMNPSVEEIVDAIESMEAESIIVLPNNRNIKLSAEQASNLVEKEVLVIDTKSIPEGLAALLALDRNKTFKENFSEMNKQARQVKTGEITYATRDAVVDGIFVKKDHFIGICNGRLAVSTESVNDAVLELVRFLLTGDEEILTLFYGQDISTEQVGKLTEILHEEFPELEVEIQYGGQPLYSYLLSME
ncbi:MAG: DAK2 domain-containing protein [Firmicutes bacterium]|nr:DAK2 domain-containing protein [Bacillota bacterium]